MGFNKENSKSRIHKLSLSNFRNYDFTQFLPKSNIIVIHGSNGIGKTNILESISLLMPGKGIRNARLEEMDNKKTKRPWKIGMEVHGSYDKCNIDISREVKSEAGRSKKNVNIDGVQIRKQSRILEDISVVWFVPQMDQIFTTGSYGKRKFFDKIVANFSKDHTSMLAKFDYLSRERLNLLRFNRFDEQWLFVLERKIAETSVIIAEARQNFCEYINNIIKEMDYDFPKATISIDGKIEQRLGKCTALQLEDEICELLQHNRIQDKENGRTNAGIHRSDLIVYYSAKNTNAELCSTGEQKSLLISIFLGEIFAHIKWYNRVPILLLDEIMSHLDVQKRKVVFDVVLGLDAQVWVTAVDADSLEFAKSKIQQVTIKNNELIS